jgi:hypothetical protein
MVLPREGDYAKFSAFRERINDDAVYAVRAIEV